MLSHWLFHRVGGEDDLGLGYQGRRVGKEVRANTKQSALTILTRCFFLELV